MVNGNGIVKKALKLKKNHQIDNFNIVDPSIPCLLVNPPFLLNLMLFG